jgi:hypothetical protein
VQLVQQPQRASPSSPMPPVRLPPAELEALVLFLQAQVCRRSPERQEARLSGMPQARRP